jgi:hypothetical protein
MLKFYRATLFVYLTKSFVNLEEAFPHTGDVISSHRWEESDLRVR